MSYVQIRNSIAAVLVFGFGMSQFGKALRNLRRRRAGAEGAATPRSWLHVTVLILSLSFMALAVNVFAATWQPSNSDIMDTALGLISLKLAFIPIGIAAIALGTWMVKWGGWSGVVQRRLVTRSGVLDRTTSLTMGVVGAVMGFGFAFVGFVLLALALQS